MIPLPATSTVIQQGIADRLHLGGQIYVSLRGDVVADEAFGESNPGSAMQRDDLMIWLSSTKPIAAVAIAQLWERRLLDLDDRIVKFIPEFGANGKESITIRHILMHTAGFRGPMNVFTAGTWEQIIERVCKMKLEYGWTPGEKAGYHVASSWFVLAEMVRRIVGRTFDVFVRDEIFLPLMMNDSWVGMPLEKFNEYGERMAPMYVTEKGEFDPKFTGNSPEANILPRPGGNGRGPMRELGRFYEMLLAGGTLDGAKILSPATVEQLVRRQRAGMFDHTFKHVVDWGLGFIVNSNRYGVDTVPYGYGPHASEKTFGHSGNQSSAGFADPAHQLVVSIAFNGMPGEEKHDRRIRAVLGALYEDLNLTTTPA